MQAAVVSFRQQCCAELQPNPGGTAKLTWYDALLPSLSFRGSTSTPPPRSTTPGGSLLSHAHCRRSC